MSFFAIRKSRFDGVYSFTTKEQAASMQAVAKGCSCRFFNDDEQEAALKWAGVSEVSEYTMLLNASAALEPSPEPYKKSSALSNLLSAALSKKSSTSEGTSATPKQQKENIKKSLLSTPTGEPAPATSIPAAPKATTPHTVAPKVIEQLPPADTNKRYRCTNKNCGAESDEKVRFCAECGSPMAEIVPVTEAPVPVESAQPAGMPTSSSWVCSSGHTNPIEYRFCMECGEEKKVSVPVPDPVPVQWTCSSGHINPNNSNFCMECGERRTAAAATEVPQPAVVSVPEPEPTQIMEDKVNVPTEEPVTEEASIPEVKIEFKDETAAVQVSTEADAADTAIEAPSIDPERKESKRYEDSDFDRITNTITTGGFLKEILSSFKMMDVPLIKLSLTSGQEVYIVLNDLYYADEDTLNSCYITSKNDPAVKVPFSSTVKSMLDSNKIKKVPKAWVFPHKDYLILDRVLMPYMCDIFSNDRHLIYITRNSIETIEEVEHSPKRNDLLPITDKNLIEEIQRLEAVYGYGR